MRAASSIGILARAGIFLAVAAGLSAAGLAHADDRAVRAPGPAPNILIIVADDLGYTDLGSFGSEIATPNLDRIAREGLRFSNFHAYSTCAPTRASLLTGVDHHVAGIGSQVPTPRQKGMPGYEGYLNERVETLAEILQPEGYRTYLSGKWHLGTTPQTGPGARGFQESFALLPGGASHFQDRLPLHPAEPAVYLHNGKVVDPLPEDFYSTVAYTDWMLSWLKRDAGTGKPFLAYLAYTAPHDPLQAPEDVIARHKGRYDLGWEHLREKRFAGLKAEGLASPNAELPPWPDAVPRWNELSAAERALKARDMEVYAAMIDVLDAEVGLVIDYLEATGELNNTWIFFLSDNGANGLPVTIYPTHTAGFHAQFDNRLSNRGAAGSFVELGSGWATASTAAFRLFKGFSTEGGIRTPAFVRPPGGMTSGSHVSDTFVHVLDIAPTVLELAGLAHPLSREPGRATFAGRSILPLFAAPAAAAALTSEVVSTGYELHGTRAFIRGDWKIIQIPLPLGSGKWELYNLASDPAETSDLAAKHPDILTELKASYAQYRDANGVIDDLPAALKQPYLIYHAVLYAVAVLVAATALYSLWQVRMAKTVSPPLRFVRAFLAVGALAGAAGLFTAHAQAAALVLIFVSSAEAARCLITGPRLGAVISGLSVAGLLLIGFLRSEFFLERFLQGF